MVMMTNLTLPETRTEGVRKKRKRLCAIARRRSRGFAHLLALCVLLLSLSIGHSGQEFQAILEEQRKALTDAVTRGDATRVARIFTSDARLMVPG